MSELSRKRERARAEPSRLYARRRKTLIKAAADVFRVKGFSDASLNDVSRSIGVDRATLYYYFGSKEQLFRAVILESIEEVVAGAQAIVEGPGSARTRLAALIRHVVGSFRTHYPSLHIFVQEDMRRVHGHNIADGATEERRLAELADLYMAGLEDLIRGGTAAGEFRDLHDPRSTASAIQGALNWMHRWFDPSGDDADADVGLADLFVTLLLDGLVQADQPAVLPGLNAAAPQPHIGPPDLHRIEARDQPSPILPL